MKKEYKIGIAGVVALVALFMGIRFLQGKNLFNTNHEYYVSFANARGLVPSSKVYADGVDVGIVTDILYDYQNPGRVKVEISVDPRLILRKGTRIQLDAGLMGGCTLNIYPGIEEGLVYKNGDTIQGYEQTAIIDKAAEMMPDIRQVIARMDTLVATLNKVVGDPNIPLVVNNVQKVTADLRLTTQSLNRLMDNDVPQILATYNQLGKHTTALVDHFKQVDIRPTIDSVNYTLSNVNSLLARIQSNEGTIGALLNDRSMYNNLNHTIQSADSLVTDLKAHPKRYVHFSVFGRKDK